MSAIARGRNLVRKSVGDEYRCALAADAAVFRERIRHIERMASKSTSTCRREIQTLAPEPLLLFLCAHGAKHMFERLGWICDIARFLQVTTNLDWTGIQAQSRRASAMRQLSLGLHLARELLDAPAPKLDDDPEVERVAQSVSNRLLSGATPPVPALESTRYTLRLLETPAQRLRCLAGLYLTPSEAEYRALQLPPSLFFLYYPFRPLRLLWKHNPLSPRERVARQPAS